MKKATLLLTLLLISTFGFSQNKGIAESQMVLDSNSIDTIVKDQDNKPIPIPEKGTLIDQMNKLELEYMNLKANEVQNSFAKQDLSKLKTKEEVFQMYIAYLEKSIQSDSNETPKTKTKDHDLLKHFRVPRAKIKNNIDEAFVRRFSSLKEFPESNRPLRKTGKDSLIDQVNNSEFEYLNLKANDIQNSFAKQDLSKLKTKEEIYKAYSAYLKKKIKEEKTKIKKAIYYGSARSNKQTIKANDQNINTSRPNKKEQ
ncbi:hypothetical protein ES677_14695 [Bizionia gelidisalsuginis]|uniref:Uncharacterized protein n=1 Tax=Bizionia gelidisalsuginis TaxID=291188 RepID=A0ABY3M6Y9_9FLAO|nr:hypothetical protein [Bizionia gelidisalsuginis]TYC07974.1 hypothetical protein ES677_14695 [Bizionia gelidisalsuginis]